MKNQKQQRRESLAQTLDGFMALDLTGLGIISVLTRALMEKQPGPMCLGAARFIGEALENSEGPAVIATGFPMGGGFAETDGPVGAAMLARALVTAFGRRSVIVIDENWLEIQSAACLGAGLMPVMLGDQAPGEVPYLNQVYLRPVPKEDAACHKINEKLLASLDPALLVAVERPGRNHKGARHGLNGRPLTGWVADLDHLFGLARGQNRPVLAVGDGGNELGMGLVAHALPEIMPQALDCGCGCGGNVTASFSADYLVVSSVSNWGVTGIIGGLALLREDPEILHDAAREVRAIEMCAAAGGLDGASVSPEPAVDGISAPEWAGLIDTMAGTLRRGLGLVRDWRRRDSGSKGLGE